MLRPAEAQNIHELNPAELGAVAHLYRGEIYRSTIWRTRLDNTTNWSKNASGWEPKGTHYC